MYILFIRDPSLIFYSIHPSIINSSVQIAGVECLTSKHQKFEAYMSNVYISGSRTQIQRPLSFYLFKLQKPKKNRKIYIFHIVLSNINDQIHKVCSTFYFRSPQKTFDK